MTWQEDLAHEQANLRTIQLHKFSPLEELGWLPPAAVDTVPGLGAAVERLRQMGYSTYAYSLADFGATLWRCRLANLKWSYGETKEIAMERAVKRWSHRGRRPSWER